MQTATQEHQKQRKCRPSTRTLLPFLRACVGCPVVVELTNDDVMRGILDSVDDGMNLVLIGGGNISEGVRWTRRGTSEPRAVLRAENETSTPNPFFAPSLHVRGRRIRFVHLPPSVDPAKIVDAARERAAAARAAYRREILTKAHGGGGGARKKGRGADEEGGSTFGSEGSSEAGDDDDNNQYYYEDYDDEGDDEEGKGEEEK